MWRCWYSFRGLVLHEEVKGSIAQDIVITDPRSKMINYFNLFLPNILNQISNTLKYIIKSYFYIKLAKACSKSLFCKKSSYFPISYYEIKGLLSKYIFTVKFISSLFYPSKSQGSNSTKSSIKWSSDFRQLIFESIIIRIKMGIISYMLLNSK